LKVFETFTFPDLDGLSKQMLVDIMNDLIEGSNELAYDAEIQEHGGVEAVAKHLCDLVSPEVKCLFGRKVTTQMLQEVRKEQMTASSKGAGGYLDFVTDDAETTGCGSMLDSSTTLHVRSCGSIVRVSPRARAHHCTTS
jgi:hypothetical protein